MVRVHSYIESRIHTYIQLGPSYAYRLAYIHTHRYIGIQYIHSYTYIHTYSWNLHTYIYTSTSKLVLYLERTSVCMYVYVQYIWMNPCSYMCRVYVCRYVCVCEGCDTVLTAHQPCVVSGVILYDQFVSPHPYSTHTYTHTHTICMYVCAGCVTTLPYVRIICLHPNT